MSVHAGNVEVICPACETLIGVDVSAEIVQQGDNPYLATTPDMTDLWAHMWTHEGEDA